MNNTEEIVVNQNQESTNEPELRGYKSVCAKLGLSMCVYFLCRMLASFAASWFFDIAGYLSETLASLIYYIIITVLTYIVPLVFTVIIFKYKHPLRVLYKKPRRVARALGTFPAAYGLGYGIILLTLLVAYILYRTLGIETLLEDVLRPSTVGEPGTIFDLVMMVMLLVVAAPIFEEYWVRGIMFDALRPYGAGMAILISSLLFGFMHGSLYMLFYTTALGLALGYIRYATGSLFIPTILHAMINSISATILLLSSLVEMTDGQYRVLNTIEMIYMVAVLAFILIGIVAFFTRIPTIRKYRFENPWTAVGPWKKLGVFFISIPVVLMLVLIFNEMSGQLLLGLIIN